MFDTLRPKIKAITNTKEETETKLKDICNLLQENVPHYDWVGYRF